VLLEGWGTGVLNEESVRIGGKPLARGNRSKEKKNWKGRRVRWDYLVRY